MSQNKTGSYHSKQDNAQAVCEYCEGILRHEQWCQTVNPVVGYARRIVSSPNELTIADAIILHSLGVLWNYCRTSSQHSLLPTKRL
jgi:hypothetical protein